MKLFTGIATILILLILTTSLIYAQEQFFIDNATDYQISETGEASVNHLVTLENTTSAYYAKNYSLVLDNIKPVNIHAYSQGVEMKVDEQYQENTTTISIKFDNAIIGKGSKHAFNITYDVKSFVSKTGEVWEIQIPKLSDANTFRSYNVSLFVPLSFGNEAFITPEPYSRETIGNNHKYSFDKDSVARLGISAGFGEFQVFSYILKYHLQNPISKESETVIALPPDTQYQKVYYDKLEPRPQKVDYDNDGNWLAVYKLAPNERIDVQLQGAVQLFSSPRSDLPKPTKEELVDNLKPTKFWQSESEEILNLAKIYKTPKEIYDYVSSYLTYDYSRVNQNIERKGALEALKNPRDAICMEYTDLFIAISRAAGIPAREVNGYAYTQNKEIEPLSLVADVLHAWPEYWDFDRSSWVPVDPTWSSTTGGVDFFDTVDLRHFTFVNHGIDPEKPYPAGSYKLGPDPQKDVFVTFGDLPQNHQIKPLIIAEIKNTIPLLPPKVKIKIYNDGPTSIYNQSAKVYFDGKLANEQEITLLPYNTYEYLVSIPYSLLSLNSPENINIMYSNASITIPTYKYKVIVYNLLSFLMLIIFILILILLRFKKLSLKYYVKKIKKI